MKRLMILLCLIMAVGVFAACEEDDGFNFDTITDVTHDDTVQPDTPADTPIDTPPDITTDLPIDTPVDTPVDTPPDTPIEIIPDSTGAYGTLSVNFSTPFILDGNNDTDEYIQAHMDAILMVAAFTGSYSSGKSIPGSTAAVSISYGLHFPAEGTSPATVAVFQDSFTDTTGTTPANPMIRLFFPSDAISTGAYSVDLMTATSIQLFVVNFIGTTDICILAVGWEGSINVTGATNTSATDGGTLAFSGSNIQLYHPTSTPMGDISGDFTSQGLQVCPME